MDGPEIIARTMSVQKSFGKFSELTGRELNYHPRSDDHSKIACWAIAFDLLQHCPLLREHVEIGKVAFGINHEITDFASNRKKNLDLVICVPRDSERCRSLSDLAAKYHVVLTPSEESALAGLPSLREAPVGSVLVTLEAKAVMTEFGKAGPRLYDELNSSHQIVHGASNHTLAAGLVMVNISDTFFSPTNNLHLQHMPGGDAVMNIHQQPGDAERAIRRVESLPRKSGITPNGYDALGIVVVECPNLPATLVNLQTAPPAPPRSSPFHYDQMIHRIAGEYATHFSAI